MSVPNYQARVGARRHTATFEKHNGNSYNTGNPTYDNPGDWDPIIEGWFCEVLTVQGGEMLRGRQVAANTSHVLFGEYYGAEGATPDMRIVLEDGTILNTVAVFDPWGDAREMRVEAKREQ